MKKYLFVLAAVLMPIEIFSLSLFGDPVDVPPQKEYVIYSKHIETKPLPNTKYAHINTTLLIYNIQTQTAKATQMYYIKNNQLHNFKDSSWAIPVSRMLTVATFEYILDHNIVSNLAFQDINIRQNFTLSGTTPYGPMIDLDNHKFFFYITFYLKDEKTGETKIKTISYRREITDNDVTANKYAELTNIGLTHILSKLRPWLVQSINSLKKENKTNPPEQSFLGITSS